MSGVFEFVENNTKNCSATSFADDCGFLVEASNYPELFENLQKAGNLAIRWGISNLLQFDHGKTEAVLFTRRRKVKTELWNTNIQKSGKTFKFNKEATRWLGFWLDSALTFRTHKEVYLQKAKKAEARLRSIVSAKGLSPGLVRKVQIAAVQSIATYGAELWWKNQKTWEQEFQKLINRQARTITGMFRTSPIGVTVKEAGLLPTGSILNNRQRCYALRLLSLPEDNKLREILPETFRDGDAHAQPGEQEQSNWDWSYARKANGLGQWLANSIQKGTRLDTTFGIEHTERIPEASFPRKIPMLLDSMEAKRRAINHSDSTDELSFWTDGSKLDDERTGVGIAWKSHDGRWRTTKVYIGKNKQIFDAELYGIDRALDLAFRAGCPRATQLSQKTRENLAQLKRILVWSDSKNAINRIQNLRSGPGQWLARRIHEQTKNLQDLGITVEIRWAPGHEGIEGNDRADEAAKQAAKNGKHCRERFASLAYIRGLITERKGKESRIWFSKEHRSRKLESRETYKLTHTNNGLNEVAARTRKSRASQYYQLKSGHAFIGSYLYKIKKANDDRCNNCWGAYRQTVRHLMLECRKWRRERDIMWRQAKENGSRLHKGTTSIKDLFSDVKITRAILQYLEDTRIGTRPNQRAEVDREHQRRYNLGIVDLDEEEENLG